MNTFQPIVEDSIFHDLSIKSNEQKWEKGQSKGNIIKFKVKAI